MRASSSAIHIARSDFLLDSADQGLTVTARVSDFASVSSQAPEGVLSTLTIDDVQPAGSGGDSGLGPQYWTVGGYDRGGGSASNGKTSFTIDQAAVQLTRNSTGWGGGAHALGTPASVTYAYRSTMVPINMPDDTTGFTRFTDVQIAAAELSLKSWSDVANITFTRQLDAVGGSNIYSDNASILFGNYSSGAAGAAAFAYYPGSSAAAGDVWVNISQSANQGPALWTYGAQTLTHELGHAIGLSHPGDYNAGENVVITYASNAEYFEDSRQYTVMSYFGSGADTTGASLPGFAASPQLDDIAAAQRLYGANMTTRTGDTVYGFNSNADRPWFYATAGVTPVFAVWDAGGNDTFDFSGYGQNQVIDLREGAFSSVGAGNTPGAAGKYNVAVAKGAVIENGIGGSGSDLLTGNAVANSLTGNAGNDILDGGAGNDVLDGGANNDDLVGGAGADTLIGGSGIDTAWYYNSPVGGRLIIDMLNPGAGTGDAAGDTFSGVERIVATVGDDVIYGTDNTDYIVASYGNDDIVGRGGADVIDGGAGLDTLWYFTSEGKLQVDLLNSGNNTGEAAGDAIFNIERLVGTEASDAFFGTDGSDYLLGQGGNDDLIGRGGADGYDGGAGFDTVWYTQPSAAGAFLRIDMLDAGASSGEAFGDVFSSIERIVGTNGQEYFFGSNGDDAFTALDGADAMEGRAGNDVLDGGAGSDRLAGGAGADTLVGGAGADAFVYFAPSDGGDRIIDFTSGVDHFEFVSAAFQLAPGAVAGDYFVAGTGPTTASHGQFIWNSGNGGLYWDDDGLGGHAAVLIAALDPGTSVTASDLLIV